MTQTLLLLPGDGIGPEVIEQTVRIAEKVAPDLNLEYGLVGGASYDEHGTPLTDETLDRAKASSAVLMGAVGGPKWDGVERQHRRRITTQPNPRLSEYSIRCPGATSVEKLS